MAICEKPAILFFLRFEKPKQRLLHTTRAGRLNLSLDSGLKGCIVNFDVHLGSFYRPFFHRTEWLENVKHKRGSEYSAADVTIGRDVSDFVALLEAEG